MTDGLSRRRLLARAGVGVTSLLSASVVPMAAIAESLVWLPEVGQVIVMEETAANAELEVQGRTYHLNFKGRMELKVAIGGESFAELSLVDCWWQATDRVLGRVKIALPPKLAVEPFSIIEKNLGNPQAVDMLIDVPVALVIEKPPTGKGPLVLGYQQPAQFSARGIVESVKVDEPLTLLQPVHFGMVDDKGKVGATVATLKTFPLLTGMSKLFPPS